MHTRLTTRLRAWILLTTFVGMLGLSWLSVDHLGVIDSACGAFGVSGQAARSQVQPAVDGPLQHCPLCHFLRSMNEAATSAVVEVGVPELSGAVRLAACQPRGATAVIHLPSRAPPATPQSFFA